MQCLISETFGERKCRSLARKYARRAGGQAVLRPVEHNLGLSLGRRGRGYRISPLATHSLSTRSTIFLTSASSWRFLDRRSIWPAIAQRRRRNSAEISSSLSVWLCAKQQREESFEKGKKFTKRKRREENVSGETSDENARWRASIID